MLQDKITEIFIRAVDFCKLFEDEYVKQALAICSEKQTRNRKTGLSDSEPILSDLTFLGVDDGENTGMRLREGTKGKIYNAIVVNFPKYGVKVSDSITTVNMNTGSLLLSQALKSPFVLRQILKCVRHIHFLNALNTNTDESESFKLIKNS